MLAGWLELDRGRRLGGWRRGRDWRAVHVPRTVLHQPGRQRRRLRRRNPLGPVRRRARLSDGLGDAAPPAHPGHYDRDVGPLHRRRLRLGRPDLGQPGRRQHRARLELPDPLRRRMQQRPPARVPARHRRHPRHPGLSRRYRRPRRHDLQHRRPVHSLVPRRRRPVAALGRELRRLHHGDVHRRRVGLVRHGDRLRRHPLPELRLRGQPRRMVYHRCLPRHQRVLPLPGSDRRAPCLARSRRADTRLRHTERRYGPQLLLAGLLTTESAPLTRLVPS